MANLRYTAETSLPPQKVIDITTDFTDRRLHWWPSIDPKVYAVHALGDGWADVTEGSAVMGGIWAHERYEWSGSTVTARVQESNVFRRGTWQLTATAKPGGSVVTVVNNRRARGARGHLMGAMLQLGKGKPLARALRQTLAIAEESHQATRSDH